MNPVPLARLVSGPLLVIAAGTLLACSSGPWVDKYLKKGVDRLTPDQVIEKLGPPHTAKTPVLGGDIVWTYRVPLGEKDLNSMDMSGFTDAANSAAALLGKGGADGPKPTLYCYRYTLTFNESKILKHWKREECVPGTRDQLNAS